MHESLHLKNISRIRGSLRPLAETAAAGSAEHVLMLQLRTSQLSDAQAVLLLPVIFLHLDPAGIPEIDELDGLISLTSAMDGAIAAFMTLGKIRHTIPPAASLDIWSRLWPWIDFFHLYWKNLPRLCKEDEAEATPLHVFIILTLAMHERTRDIICSTGGVRRVLAMGWKALVYSDSPPLARIAEIVYLLTVVSNQGRDFDEIVEGVGGNVEDLAAVVLKQIPDAYAREKSDLVGRLICACLSLFGEVQGEGAAFLFDAALESALVPTLISAILAIHGTPAGIAVQSCLLYLITSLQYRFGAHTVQALEAGLLRVILVVGGSPTKRSIEPGTHAATTAKMIAGLLEEILPKALVHYDVVLNMKQSFGRAEALASSTGITKSPLAKEWQEFSVMAKKRLSLLESWEERSKVSFKGCDNMLCQRIDARHMFKTCSTCYSADYCSKHCQAADWRAGHREMCKELRTFQLRNPETLSTRGKCFLRELLTEDYFMRLVPISVREVLFMYEHPGEPFHTTFAYSDAGDVQVEIQRIADLKRSKVWDAAMEAHLARVERSEGRMHFHLVLIFEGQRFRRIVFPLRTDTSRLRDGLRRIAQLIPPGKTANQVLPQVRKDVDAFVREVEQTMVVIH